MKKDNHIPAEYTFKHAMYTKQGMHVRMYILFQGKKENIMKTLEMNVTELNEEELLAVDGGFSLSGIAIATIGGVIANF